MPSEERPGLQVAGGMAMGCGFLLIALASALIVSALALKDDCRPATAVCGEGGPLSMLLAAPFMLGGLVVALAGWIAFKAGRRKG